MIALTLGARRCSSRRSRLFSTHRKLDHTLRQGDKTRSLITLRGISKIIANDRRKTPLLHDIDATLYKGAKVGILGHNGSGKSTLMRILGGVDTDFDGQRTVQPSISVGYLHQEPELDTDLSVKENVKDGVREKFDILQEFEDVSAQFADPEADFEQLLERQNELHDIIESQSLWTLEEKVDETIRALGCPPPDSNVADLSGGERRRVALARLLISKPDVLLLDEPTNHLDHDSVEWLEQFLEQFEGTVLCVTHDRYFLDNVAGWILDIENSKVHMYNGNYSVYSDTKQQRREQAEREKKQQTKKLEREEKWAGRNKKNRARLNRLADLKKTLTKDTSTYEHSRFLRIDIPEGPMLGDRVLDLENVSYSLDDGSQLLNDVNFQLRRGDIVGVIGPNGCGKSTLLKILTGEYQASSGEVSLGNSVSLGYISQARTSLDDQLRVWEDICGGLDFVRINDEKIIPSRSYCAQFNFRSEDQDKFVSQMSGGERNRAMLAKCLRLGCNVLLLDEPSNDLDMDTLRALENSISTFPGAVVVVSHDRWFLDRVANRILSFEADGKVQAYQGNYVDYQRLANSRGSEKSDRAKSKMFIPEHLS